jgi:protein SCO1/2
MQRREFLSLGLTPLLMAAGPLEAAPSPAPVSRAARAGLFPNVPLITHTSRHVNFYDDLVRGRTVLINFFLIQCTDGVCPTSISTMRKVQDLLGDRMGRDVFFYSITLEPRKDTPKALGHYAANFDIRPGWEFLTGKPANIEKLRRALGYVDADPERDKDLTNHIGLGRYGNDRLERWGGVSLASSPENIASTFKWLTL